MRSMLKILISLLTVALMTACASVRQIDIEVFNPSEVTFPDHVTKLLVVNNAVPQAPYVGSECLLFGVVQDTCLAYADSALFEATRSLGEAIVDADFYDDVLLYNKPTRTDKSFLSDVKLTAEQVEELCLETGADAVISFDRLLFNSRRSIVARQNDFYEGLTEVGIAGVVRAYLPYRQNAIVSVVMSDSVRLKEHAIGLESLKSTSYDDLLKIAGGYIGKLAAYNFIPFWTNDVRFYYTSADSRWKEAVAFIVANKWEQSAEKWQAIYEREQSGKKKAKAANNLALCTEISGDFEKACEWAVRSRDLFSKHLGADHAETKQLTLYVEKLQKRAQADKKLDLQFPRR